MSNLRMSAMDAVVGLYVFCGSETGGLLIWGIIGRGLLLVAALSLASLAWQVRGLAGSQGQSPARTQLKDFYRDFGWKALLFWPTLFWPLAVLAPHLGDSILVVLPAAAAAIAATGAVVGGITARVGAGAALAALLSIDTVHALVYPWDSLLFEALWIAQAFPNLPSVLETGDVSFAELPLPLVAFGFRLLSARLLIGFGALKFGSAGRGDHLYIKHFMIAQPMLSPLGLVAHATMPSFVWRAAVMGSESECAWGVIPRAGAVMNVRSPVRPHVLRTVVFVVEIPLPLAALAAPASWGVIRFVAAAATVGLMAGM